MKKPRTGLWLVAAIALAVAPSASATEALVPPGNSAAAQYTEAIPTGGGEKSTEGTGNKRPLSPKQILGAKNVKRLESQGAAGRATAELATETAPSNPPAQYVPPRSRGGDRTNGEGSASPNRVDRGGRGHRATPRLPATEPSGSSGFGSVIAQATGASSSGQMGAFLPLAILATILWSIVYLMRQRRRVE